MKITVVIPLYNKKDTVLRALDSVLNQQILPDEIVVVNDGSTDGSEKKVENLKHPLISLIHQKNKGVSAARNKGIEVAKSEWIAFLDADDIWKVEYLETINLLQYTYRDARVLATSYISRDYKGREEPIMLYKLPFSSIHGVLSNYFEVACNSHPPIWSSAVVVNKKAIVSVGGFPDGVKDGEDLLTWAKLATKNKIAYNINPMAIYVLDESNSYQKKPTRIPEKYDFVGAELELLYLKYKTKYLRIYISHWKKMRASNYLRLGNRKKAKTEAFLAINYYPFNYKLYLYVLLTLLPKKIVFNLFKKLN